MPSFAGEIWLYCNLRTHYPDGMNIAGDMIYWTVGLGVAGLVAHFVAHNFSPEARERRRCRRNHRKVKVVSRAKRPVVMLSAKVPKQ